MSINKENTHRKIGYIGEQIVRVCLEIKGHKVEMSMDPFDQQKDMTIDNTTAEIKTQARFWKYNSFGLRSKSLEKWDKADRRFFVEIPLENRDDPIYVWECLDPSKFSKIKGSDNRFYRLEHLHLYDTVVNLDLSHMLYDFSTSEWKGKVGRI